eukprot:1136444-Rhodomonas_salina.2
MVAIRGLSQAAYIRGIRTKLEGDVLTLQAFCDVVGGEVATWDPTRTGPAICRGNAVEIAEENRPFTAERVAAAGEGDLVHYNSLTVDQDTINRGIETDYEIVRRMTKEGGKYWEWVTRREGRVTVKGQDGSVSAQGSGTTKEEARENMARLLLVRIQASKKRQREETKQDIRKWYKALVREKQ